jgi:hypothetical protein
MLRLLLLFITGLLLALGGPSLLQPALNLPRFLLQIPTGLHALISGRTRVYCYGSVTTLDDKDTVFAPGCLSVDTNGNFGKVFSAAGLSSDDMRAKGWDVDLRGHVLPGLWDGHAHLLQYGEMLGSVQVYNTRSLEGFIPPSGVYERKLT